MASAISLVIPGMVWPRQAFADLTFDLSMPALSALLGFAVPRPLSSNSTYSYLATAFQLAEPLPAAALRRLTTCNQPDADNWLCLDPVTIQFEQQRPVLGNPADLHLSESEAQALIDTLMPLFASLGQLSYGSPAHWYLRLPNSAPHFQSLPDHLHRTSPLLPRDATYAPWRRAISEAETVLHSHPINQARDRAGLPRVSGLIPWGGGALPSTPPPMHESPRLMTSDPVLQGLSYWAGGQSLPLTEQFDATADIVVLDELAAATQRGDGNAWREALHAMETRWFAPALNQFRRGRVSAIRLVAPDARGGWEAELRRMDRLKFWRKPVRLATALQGLLPP